MTKCCFEDRIAITEAGNLVRVVKATSVSKRQPVRTLDVYREDEDGKAECRNLYIGMLGGYLVGFPNERNSLYGSTSGNCSYVEKEEKFGECNRLKSFPSRNLSEEEKALVAGVYPEFRYVLEKWQGCIEDTMKALAIWKEHKEIELVFGAGYVSVALNKSFWKLSEKKRKEVVLFMRKNPTERVLTLADIQTILKYGLSMEEFKRYEDFYRWNRVKISYDVYSYLTKIGMADRDGVALYKDYTALLRQTSHDKKEEYWKHPADLQARHDRLRQEVENIKAMEEAEKLRARQEAYTNAVKGVLACRTDVDGYTVYVPETVEDIKVQADKLHQCLISCDYVSKVIKGACVLVFIRKGGEPIATAELLRGDKLGQFYANELDRSNCLPSEDVRAAFDKWLEAKKTARKNSRKAA